MGERVNGARREGGGEREREREREQEQETAPERSELGVTKKFKTNFA